MRKVVSLPFDCNYVALESGRAILTSLSKGTKNGWASADNKAEPRAARHDLLYLFPFFP
jgi:hypothetical protein